MKKKHFSNEYTMLSILEYICNNSVNTRISKYHIIHKIPEIKKQRSDRISHLLEILEKNGYIESQLDNNTNYYKATQEGFHVYNIWVSKFLQFVRESEGI